MPYPAHARPRRRGDTRGAILRAAEAIFAEAGLAGARTQAIAARAGVNKALLYYYFRGKDALFQEVLDRHVKEFYTQAMEVLLSRGPARATLLRFVSTHFDFISSRPFYPRLFQRLVMTGGKPLERLARKYFTPLLRKLVGVIERGIRGGELRRADSRHTAISLVALTVHYFSAAPILRLVGHIDPYGAANLKHRKEEVLSFIRFALFRDPEAHPP